MTELQTLPTEYRTTVMPEASSLVEMSEASATERRVLIAFAE